MAQVGPLLSGSALAHASTDVDGRTFISPAHAELRTAVELDVLLLVPPRRSSTGDIDNRMKTLLDGLTRPANLEQLRGFSAPPDGGPTYCLMDDDRLVRRLSFDSRRWFDPAADPQEALAIVTATLVLGDNADMTSPTGNIFLVL